MPPEILKGWMKTRVDWYSVHLSIVMQLGQVLELRSLHDRYVIVIWPLFLFGDSDSSACTDFLSLFSILLPRYMI